MESKVAVVSNSDLPVVTGKSKEDALEESGSQVSGGGDSFEESAAESILANLVPDIDLTEKLFANQEVPEPGPTAGSTGSLSDLKSSPLKLTSASGPAPSSGTLVAADTDDHSAGPRSPEAKNSSAHPPAERSPSKSSSSHGGLLETKSSSQETKAYPDLPSYDSLGGWIPGDVFKSKPSSQETKASPDVPSDNSQGGCSPRDALESKPSSQETKAYPDLLSYSTWSPGNSLETDNSGNLAEDSADLSLLAGANWKKWLKGVPDIPPAVDHAEDSNSTELDASPSRSQSSSNSD